MKPNLKVNFAGIKLNNPVLTASGTFGYGDELADLIPLKRLGGIITKTITLHPRVGNPPPRIAEVTGGMLNTIGLQNIGVERFISEKLPSITKIGVPIIVSVAGATADEYVSTVKLLSKAKGISGIELNLSCPNLKKTVVCHDEQLFNQVIKQCKKYSNVPVIAKLTPQVADIAALAVKAQNSGADGVTLCNTFPAMAIDINTFKPKLSTVKGGMSGACVKPMAVRAVYEAYNAIKATIIGCGGIENYKDAVEFILAGATAVSVGSASLVKPSCLIEIIDGLEKYLDDKKIKNITDIKGKILC
jgi:dihydroorotate dehydrogenase (NAD+) catalytic subunit